MHPTPCKVFISYAHEDSRLEEELLTSLAQLKREGLVEVWHDREIAPGEEWKPEIDRELETSNIILLLVSPHFMASDYCQGIEVKRALERHDKGEAVVIPILLRPTDWTTSLFAKLNALPRDKELRPVINWKSHDQAFLNVAMGIRQAIANLETSIPEKPSPGSGERTDTSAKTAVRKPAKTPSRQAAQSSQSKPAGRDARGIGNWWRRLTPALQVTIVVALITLLGTILTPIITALMPHQNHPATATPITSATIPSASATTAPPSIPSNTSVPLVTPSPVPLPTVGYQTITFDNANSLQEVFYFQYPHNFVSDGSLAMSSYNGGILAAGDTHGIISLWNLRTQREISIPYIHQAAITDLQFSPKVPDLFVSSSRDTSAIIWRVDESNAWVDEDEDQNLLKIKINDQTYITALSFYPDGNPLVLGLTGDQFALFSLNNFGIYSQKMIYPELTEGAITTSDVTDVAFSPDGRLLAISSSDYSVYLWQFEQNSEIPVYKAQIPIGMYVLKTAFSNAQNYLIAVVASDGRISFYKLNDLDNKLYKFKVALGITRSMSWFPQEETLVACSDQGLIDFINPYGGGYVEKQFADKKIYGCVLSPDGKFLAVAGINGISIQAVK